MTQSIAALLQVQLQNLEQQQQHHFLTPTVLLFVLVRITTTKYPMGAVLLNSAGVLII